MAIMAPWRWGRLGRQEEHVPTINYRTAFPGFPLFSTYFPAHINESELIYSL